MDYCLLQIIKEVMESHSEEPNGEVMTSVPSQIAILLVQIHCTRRIDDSIASADTLNPTLAELERYFDQLQHTLVFSFIRFDCEFI